MILLRMLWENRVFIQERGETWVKYIDNGELWVSSGLFYRREKNLILTDPERIPKNGSFQG